MNIARYADYIGNLRTLFVELDQHPERFQTFEVHIELAVGAEHLVYETRRRKGQTDSLYYGRSGGGGKNRQVSQAVAFTAVDSFFSLGQFLALTGQQDGDGSGQTSVDSQYPHCAVAFSYRKKGQPETRSMLMVFVGLTDEDDALRCISSVADGSIFVGERPYHAAKIHEWK